MFGITTIDTSSRRLPFRRSTLVVGAAALAVVVALPSLLASRDDRAAISTSASSGVTDPVASAPATTEVAGALPAAAPLAATVAQPAATTAPAKAAAAPAPPAAATCLNSTDPSCGAFAWSPAPAANQPLTIAVEVFPAQPRVGELVTVKVIATDPDALVTTNGGSYFFADPHSLEPQIGFAATVDAGVTRYGQWTPPPAQPGRLELSFTHTFSQAGTFDFTFAALSGDEGDPGNVERNPYASRGSAKVPISVGS